MFSVATVCVVRRDDIAIVCYVFATKDRFCCEEWVLFVQQWSTLMTIFSKPRIMATFYNQLSQMGHDEYQTLPIGSGKNQ